VAATPAAVPRRGLSSDGRALGDPPFSTLPALWRLLSSSPMVDPVAGRQQAQGFGAVDGLESIRRAVRRPPGARALARHLLLAWPGLRQFEASTALGPGLWRAFTSASRSLQSAAPAGPLLRRSGVILHLHRPAYERQARHDVAQLQPRVHLDPQGSVGALVEFAQQAFSLTSWRVVGRSGRGRACPSRPDGVSTQDFTIAPAESSTASGPGNLLS